MGIKFIDTPIYIHGDEDSKSTHDYIPAPVIFVDKIYCDSYMEKNSNIFFPHNNIRIFNDNIDIKDTNGNLLLKFRKQLLSVEDTRIIYTNMKTAAPKSGGRAEASGIDGNPYKTQISKNGKTLRLLKKKVRSGITGYYDNKSMFGTTKITPCRTTAFTANNMTKFMNCVPIIEKIDKLHKLYCPKLYNLQKKAISEIDNDYVISDTCYTTITVNKNFRIALHKDKGDFKDGIGVLTVVQEGKSEGGYTIIPQYGIGVNCRSGDLLLMDVHQWHCNTEITGEGTRLSLVLYLRDKMRKICKKV